MKPEDKLLVDKVAVWRTQPPPDQRDIDLMLAKMTLKDIMDFGHGCGHGRGYTCANMAKEALEILEENYYDTQSS